jgi:hypothetical protein
MPSNVNPDLKAKHMAEKHGTARAIKLCYDNYQSYSIADAGYWYWCEVYDHLLGAP